MAPPKYCSGHSNMEDCLGGIENKVDRNAEDMILIKHTLDIKELKNGQRDAQIKYATERINEVGSITQREDETLGQRIVSLSTDMAEIKGYMKSMIFVMTILMGLFMGHIFKFY